MLGRSPVAGPSHAWTGEATESGGGDSPPGENDQNGQKALMRVVTAIPAPIPILITDAAPFPTNAP